MKRWRFTFVSLGLLALACSPVAAAEFNLDFETDPQDLNVDFFGTSEWRDSDGFEDSGYLSITDALNSQRGAIIFPDLENGAALTAFHITADLRVGGGTARPADGFSFNFARPDDPVLDDGEGWAASPTGEGNLPEEGTTTGLAIGFDEWFSGGSDVVGMSIRIDNELVDQFEFPVLNGEVDDEESLQTGPEGVFDDELQDLMGWAKLDMRLCANNLQVSYKGVEVFNQDLKYRPSPGQLVFGGRTGGANAYHHIDNVTIATGSDVGEGCEVTPPFPVGGNNTIGTEIFTGEESNLVFGPEAPGTSGVHLLQVNTNGETVVDSHTVAEEVLDDELGDVFTGSARRLDIGGGGGDFPDTLPYPDGTTDASLEDFAVRATADVKIPAGTWTIGVGSDDGAQITIEGVEFTDFSEPNDSFDDNQIRFEGNRGHGWTVGSFTLAEELETTLVASFHERGGGDSFEVAVIDDGVIEDASPDAGWEILADGVFGWEVTHTGIPLVSADIDASVGTGVDYEFEINGDTDESDMFVLVNPDADVYTTKLDIDGIKFIIEGTGSFADGDAFTIVDASMVVGTPIIESADPAQTWSFNAATGQVVFGAGGGVAGDFNGNGARDVEDLDLLTDAMLNGGAASFDLNGDGEINLADRQFWLVDLTNTFFGDSNFDGQFNSSDFVAVFGAAKYEKPGVAATFAEGDWNGDGLFNSSDFVTAFAGGGYEQGPRDGGLQTVPEPSSIGLILFGFLGLLGFRRK